MEGQKANLIKPQMFAQQVLNQYPQAVQVFVDHQMACVGCPMAGFETIEEIASNYRKDADKFLEALEQCTAPKGKIKNLPS